MSDVIRDIVNTVSALSKRVRRLEASMYTPKTIVDYSATSTIVGWSAYTAQYLYYLRTGDLVFVLFSLSGTSDNEATTFTLPFTARAGVSSAHFPFRAINNGGTAIISYGVMSAGTSTVTLYSTPALGAWTASGTKTVRGQLFYVV